MSITERITNYLSVNPLKVLWTLALIFGFLLFLSYCFEIRFIPLLDGDQVPYLLVIIFAFGVFTLLILTGMFIVPGLILKSIEFPTKLGWKLVLGHFVSILVVSVVVIILPEIYPKLKGILGYIWFLLFVVTTFAMSYFLDLWKGDEKLWEKSFRVIFFGFSSYFMPFISISIFSIIIAQSEFPQLFDNSIGGTISEIFLIISILYIINMLVVLKEYRSVLIISLSTIIFFSPQMLAKVAPSLGKFGNFHADLLLDKVGCEILKGEGFNFANKTKGNSEQYACKALNEAKNVFILWRYGKEALIKVNEASERRILIDNKHIMAIATSDSPKSSSMQDISNGDTK